MRYRSMTVVGLILLAAGVGQANIAINPNFELDGTGVVDLNPRGFDNCLGWSGWGGSTSVAVTTDHPVARMCAQIGTANATSIWQNTGYVCQAGETYRLTASLRSRAGGWAWATSIDFQSVDGDTWANWVGRYITLSHNTTWREFSLDMSMADHPVYVGKQLGIGVELNDTDWGIMEATDIRVEIFGGSQRAGNLVPVHTATLIPVDASFSWDAPTELVPASYTLRYASDPNLSLGGPAEDLVEVTGITSRQYQPAEAFDNGTNYYWQVGAVAGTPTDPNVYFTGVNRFTTQFSVPIVMASPAKVVAGVGETAEFTCQVESVSAPSFAWYHSDDASADTPGDDTEVQGAGYVSESSEIDPDAFLYEATLTIESVVSGDAGYYYCKANNASNEPVSTAVAGLVLKEFVAWWPLGSDVGWLDMLTGTYNADPNGILWDTGVTGVADSAARIDTSVGGAIGWAEINPTEGSFQPSIESGQITISAWIQWDGTAITMDGHGIVSKRQAGSDMRWAFYARQGDGSHTGANWLRWTSHNGGDVWVGPGLFPQGEWMHVCAVVDSGNAGRVYVNGVQRGQDLTWVWGANADAPTFIGKGYVSGPAWPGSIDDVRVYNYGLSNTEVADLFFGLRPDADPVCILAYESRLDFNGDCVVDLKDMVRFLGSWLDDGLYSGTP